MSRRDSIFGILLFLAWFAIVAFQVYDHAMWRDEVRALSIALSGNNTFDMLKVLHGEGHPAVWYLLIRAFYVLIGRVEILPATALLIAAGAVALLIFRSPFPRLIIVGLTFGSLLSFEYSVMARNYGISVLVMFLIAIAYEKQRDRGFVVGLLLFILSNTNIIGAMMVGAFLLFWFLDVLEETGLRWSAKLGTFALNAGLATAGVAICALTILPTFNDAATRDLQGVSLVQIVTRALLNPGRTAISTILFGDYPSIVRSIFFIILLFGLLSRRSAFFSAFFSLFVCAIFFGVIGSGDQRHAGVWFFYCVMLYWIAWKDIEKATMATAEPSWSKKLVIIGTFGFMVLIAQQTAKGIYLGFLRVAHLAPVESRSADLGKFILSRSDLANATIIADPDYLVEALPYYVSNPTYLIRKHSLGRFVIFSRTGELTTTLGEILDESRELKKTTNAPVIILLSHRLDQIIPDKIYHEGYNWSFKAGSEEIKEFIGATQRLAQFAPAVSDESYDVYLLD
jgi:hypothetical protein